MRVNDSPRSVTKTKLNYIHQVRPPFRATEFTGNKGFGMTSGGIQLFQRMKDERLRKGTDAGGAAVHVRRALEFT